MSNFAHSRDISDPDTIRAFANIVQSPERLKLLLAIDVRRYLAVGPGVWNGWKGQLLRTLYHETEPLVAGGHTQIPRSERIDQAQAALRNALVGLAGAGESTPSSTVTIRTIGCGPISRRR